MTKLQRVLVAGPMLAFLIAAGGRTLGASAANNTGDERTNKEQASTLPLNSLDGLEVQSIREDGVDPVKTKADVATYRGRRAVRVVNDDGLTATGTPAGAQAIAIVKASDFKDGTIEADVVGLPREGAPPTTQRVCRHCVPCPGSWFAVRIDLSAHAKRARRRSIAAQPLDPVCVAAGLHLAAFEEGKPWRVRILRRSRTRCMDQDQNRGCRHQGQPLRQWRRPALPDCERSEIG